MNRKSLMTIACSAPIAFLGLSVLPAQAATLGELISGNQSITVGNTNSGLRCAKLRQNTYGCI